MFYFQLELFQEIDKNDEFVHKATTMKVSFIVWHCVCLWRVWFDAAVNWSTDWEDNKPWSMSGSERSTHAWYQQWEKVSNRQTSVPVVLWNVVHLEFVRNNHLWSTIAVYRK